MRSRWLAIVFVLAAVALAVSLLRLAHNHIETRNGGTVVGNIDGDPVLTLSSTTVDFACLKDKPCPDWAASDVVGLYPRQGIPLQAAVLGGLVLPPLLILAGIAIAAWRRWVTVLCLCAAAFVLPACLVSYGPQFTVTHADGHVEPFVRAMPITIEHIDSGPEECADRNPCRTGRFAFSYGLFAAAGVPPAVAVILGLIAPLVLAITALALGLQGRLVRGR
jgi:hypothetical protein